MKFPLVAMLADIYQVDRDIVRTFLRDADLAMRLQPRKPRYENNVLEIEQVVQILAKLAPYWTDDSMRVDGYDDDGTHMCAVGTCGCVLYISSGGASACLDITDDLVPGASFFAELE